METKIYVEKLRQDNINAIVEARYCEAVELARRGEIIGFAVQSENGNYYGWNAGEKKYFALEQGAVQDLSMFTIVVSNEDADIIDHRFMGGADLSLDAIISEKDKQIAELQEKAARLEEITQQLKAGAEDAKKYAHIIDAIKQEVARALESELAEKEDLQSRIASIRGIVSGAQ